jgi:hypothetical protein
MSSFPGQIFSGLSTTDAVRELAGALTGAAKAESSEDCDKIKSRIVTIVFCA